MSGARVTIDQLPARYQAQVSAQLHGAPPPVGQGMAKAKSAVKVERVEPADTMIRQSKGPVLNQWEAGYLKHLKGLFPDNVFHAQAMTFVLANGLRLTPDIVMFSPSSKSLTAYEVKGFMRDDAAAKIKMAPVIFPWVTWVLVWKRKKRDGGGWGEQEVLP